MVVNSNTGVDPGILRHQITDLQQDVTCIPGEQEDGAKEEEAQRQMSKKQQEGRENDSLHVGTKSDCSWEHSLLRCYLMSMVKRLLLVTGFWSGPFRVTEGLGRPHTLQQRTTVSPNAHTTSDRGLRNSGATARRKHHY